MKFLKFLSEKFLHSEFTFGFELEAYTNIDAPTNQRAYDYIDKFFPGGKIVGDSSIEGFDVNKFYSFEYNSPVLRVIPAVINKLIKFLSGLNKNEIYTNESCGFHIHMSFPFISDWDQLWIIFNLCLDENMYKKITKFKKFKFFNEEYADKSFLIKLKRALLKNHTKLKDILMDEDNEITEKYRIIRLHPQGTIEWRGPRNFLNVPKQKEIKDFVLLLWDFISWISSVLDKETILINNDTVKKHEIPQYILGMKQPYYYSGNVDQKKFSKHQDKSIIERIFKVSPWLKGGKYFNATIELKDDILPVFTKSTWEDGVWVGPGIFFNSVWKKGVFESGIFKNSLWVSGTWFAGAWENSTIMLNDKPIRSGYNPIEFFQKFKTLQDVKAAIKAGDKRVSIVAQFD